MEKQEQLSSWCCAELHGEPASHLWERLYCIDGSVRLGICCSALRHMLKFIKFITFVLRFFTMSLFVNQGQFTRFSFGSKSLLWNSLWSYFEWEHLEALISHWSPTPLFHDLITNCIEMFLSLPEWYSPLLGFGGGGARAHKVAAHPKRNFLLRAVVHPCSWASLCSTGLFYTMQFYMQGFFHPSFWCAEKSHWVILSLFSVKQASTATPLNCSKVIL